jgi:hypothetical protein
MLGRKAWFGNTVAENSGLGWLVWCEQETPGYPKSIRPPGKVN